MRRNRAIWGLVAALAGFALLLGGVAVASNMGFKFVPDLPVAAGANGYNLSLPWNNNYTNADSLLVDMQVYGAIDSVAKFETNSATTNWFGFGVGGVNFALTKGEAYIVYAGAGNPGNVHPVVVGSHDPNFTFTFPAGAFNAAAPYHQTYTTADGVLVAIQTACPGKIDSVARFETNSATSAWFGFGVGGVNFPLTLGQGVIVNANSSCAGFVWAHY